MAAARFVEKQQVFSGSGTAIIASLFGVGSSLYFGTSIQTTLAVQSHILNDHGKLLAEHSGKHVAQDTKLDILVQAKIIEPAKVFAESQLKSTEKVVEKGQMNSTEK